MSIKSISGFVLYVKDLDKTADFYGELGFRFGKRTNTSMTSYVNWFSVDFVAVDQEVKPGFVEEANAEPKGTGMFINIAVENVDDFYTELVGKGFKPSTEPTTQPWGRREFIQRDPDGYKLVFFTKK
ncbi:MAG: Glyoxalase/bleomycin resistance protein/dioxygenase [Candidatus Saccharibacteria bacterium]|nr:Glyoxalase/bleomycin resistance protein/dioxygenase [Candidatus Saccharibacteria bacterium]